MRLVYIKLIFIVVVLANCSTSHNQRVKEVAIGNQIWMSENLNVDQFRNGEFIYEARTLSEWEQAIIDKKPAWCYYIDQENFLKGKLYNTTGTVLVPVSPQKVAIVTPKATKTMYITKYKKENRKAFMVWF